MTPWKTGLLVEPTRLKLLVKDCRGKDLLKAQLLLPSAHPRALTTLLEGLALWSQPPLSVAICCGRRCYPLGTTSIYSATVCFQT